MSYPYTGQVTIFTIYVSCITGTTLYRMVLVGITLKMLAPIVQDMSFSLQEMKIHCCPLAILLDQLVSSWMLLELTFRYETITEQMVKFLMHFI